MWKNPDHSLSAAEKLDQFLELDDEELSSMSAVEIEEELNCLGVDVAGIKAKIRQTIAEDLETSIDERSVETPLPEWFGMDPALLTLGEQASAYLMSTAALSEVVDEQVQLKEISVGNFFSESTLTEELVWAGPIIRIALQLDADNKNLARHIAYVDVNPDYELNPHALRLRLGTVGGKRSEVLLSSEFPSGILQGDLLPADWDMVHIELIVEPQSYDT